MIVRYFFFLIVYLLAVILGAIGGYHLARRFKWAKKIWGNDVDGFCGDTLYQNDQATKWYRKLWPCWWWSCVRNPAHNLALNILSAKGTITSMKRSGNLTIAVIGGKKYFFFYNRFSSYKVKFGWKIWHDYNVGDSVKAEFVVNP